MSKFKFYLEPVLKHRQTCEEIAILKHVQAQKEYSQNYNRLCMIKNKLVQTDLNYNNISSFDYLNKMLYCDYMAEEVKKQEAVLEKINKKIEIYKNNVIKAMQERSIMDKLKEKKFVTHKILTQVTEQKQSDEMAIHQYFRRDDYGDAY